MQEMHCVAEEADETMPAAPAMDMLYDAMTGLNADDKELLIRYYWHGESQRVIGRTMVSDKHPCGITRQAIQYRLARAIRRLRKAIPEKG
jgi:DNA-directed RNA polymerase specialized sigma24 family protein